MSAAASANSSILCASYTLQHFGICHLQHNIDTLHQMDPNYETIMEHPIIRSQQTYNIAGNFVNL
jgi:hypothetical protein